MLRTDAFVLATRSQGLGFAALPEEAVLGEVPSVLANSSVGDAVLALMAHGQPAGGVAVVVMTSGGDSGELLGYLPAEVLMQSE
jgi:hypothetical protein